MSTFNTIKGSEPYLLLSDGITKLSGLDELMGFSMPKRDGSSAREQIEVSMASMTLIAPKDMKYNDVVPLVTANGTLQNIPGLTVGDADGDSTLISNTSVGGQMKATWYNGGVAIQPDQLNVSLDPCGGPYKLTIEISTEVTANTTYGDPNIKSYGKGSVSYSFVPKDITICYLQPKDMRIYTGGLIAYSEGYNPAIWSPGNGFSMQLMNEKSVMFPTTGFKNAAFSLIGSGNDQSRYRCSSSDDGVKIGLSGTANTKLGEKCTVTYNSLKRADFNAGGSTSTIIMEYNLGGGTWMEIGSYTIPTPNLWLIGLGRIVYGDASSLKESTSFPALDACRMAVDGNATPATTQSQALDLTAQGEAWRQKYLFRMDELTNSRLGDDSSGITRYYSRDISTFLGQLNLRCFLMMVRLRPMVYSML